MRWAKRAAAGQTGDRRGRRFSGRGCEAAASKPAWACTITCDLLDRAVRWRNCRKRQTSSTWRGRNSVHRRKRAGDVGDERRRPRLCRRAAGRRKWRFVAFSTLCVYPFSPVDGPEHRRRIRRRRRSGNMQFLHVARAACCSIFRRKTKCPGRIARLNYAIDCRLWRAARHRAVGAGAEFPLTCAPAWSTASGKAMRSAYPAVSGPRNDSGEADQHQRARADYPTCGRVATPSAAPSGKAHPFSMGTEQSTAWHNDCSEERRLFGDHVVGLDQVDDPLERGLAENAGCRCAIGKPGRDYGSERAGRRFDQGRRDY